jgi:hypothetical protein
VSVGGVFDRDPAQVVELLLLVLVHALVPFAGPDRFQLDPALHGLDLPVPPLPYSHPSHPNARQQQLFGEKNECAEGEKVVVVVYPCGGAIDVAVPNSPPCCCCSFTVFASVASERSAATIVRFPQFWWRRFEQRRGREGA